MFSLKREPCLMQAVVTPVETSAAALGPAAEEPAQQGLDAPRHSHRSDTLVSLPLFCIALLLRGLLTLRRMESVAAYVRRAVPVRSLCHCREAGSPASPISREHATG